MRDILIKGREEYGVVSVKAEFEAEGTRTDELLRLLDVAHQAQLPLTLKIGGCEAVRDLLEAKQFGVRYLVAPMIESEYALEKFASAIDLVFSPVEQENVDFLFNMETKSAFEARDSIMSVAETKSEISGVVFGRVDYVGSRGKAREATESDQVLSDVLTVAEMASNKGLDLVLGGAISVDSITFLSTVSQKHLTRFETRKVVFASNSLALRDVENGLLNAVHFELLWLLNKRTYYERISVEDKNRIDMLEQRWKMLGREVL